MEGGQTDHLNVGFKFHYAAVPCVHAPEDGFAGEGRRVATLEEAIEQLSGGTPAPRSPAPKRNRTE